jgi:ubiquinone/menaquinone biosynthesis C-methylase UbiE
MDMFADITALYTPFHAWFYESIVAPAVFKSRWIIDERFLAHLPKGAKVLDVGSGGALFTCYMAEQRPDLDILGIDLSEPQVRRASNVAKRFGGRVKFQVGSALDLAFPDGSFDGVISYGSIKHWPDWAKGVSECVRVLKPGGPFLLTDADRSVTWQDLTEFVEDWHAPKLMYPINLGVFRTLIAGRSLDVDDVRALAAKIPLDDQDVGRVKSSPLFYMSGKRPVA